MRTDPPLHTVVPQRLTASSVSRLHVRKQGSPYSVAELGPSLLRNLLLEPYFKKKNHLATSPASSLQPLRSRAKTGTCLSWRPVWCSVSSSPAPLPWTSMSWLSLLSEQTLEMQTSAPGPRGWLGRREDLGAWAVLSAPEPRCRGAGCGGKGAAVTLSAAPPNLPPACLLCRQVLWDEGGLSQTLAGPAPPLRAAAWATCC